MLNQLAMLQLPSPFPLRCFLLIAETEVWRGGVDLKVNVGGRSTHYWQAKLALICRSGLSVTPKHVVSLCSGSFEASPCNSLKAFCRSISVLIAYSCEVASLQIQISPTLSK